MSLTYCPATENMLCGGSRNRTQDSCFAIGRFNHLLNPPDIFFKLNQQIPRQIYYLTGKGSAQDKPLPSVASVHCPRLLRLPVCGTKPIVPRQLYAPSSLLAHLTSSQVQLEAIASWNLAAMDGLSAYGLIIQCL